METNQRVLLFTQHETVFLKAKNIIDPESSKKEIFLSFAGIGISIVRIHLSLKSGQEYCFNIFNTIAGDKM